MKNSKLWQGLTAIFSFILITVIALGILANANATIVDDVVGNSTVSGLTGSSYGELSDENFELMIADSYDYAERLEEEGAVLLKNDGALPLDSDERSVTLFGRNSADIVYRGVAGGPSTNSEYEVTLDKAFTDKGFEINEALFSAYESYSGTAKSNTNIGEVPISFYTSDLQATFQSYNDAAVVTFSRYGGEEADLATEDDEGVGLLTLHESEAELLKMIRDSGEFDKTVVLINSVYAMELGFLEEEEYGVNACIWIGNPGYYSLGGVVDLMTGDANPSGRTVDTFASDSMASPAMQNFGLSYYDYDDDTLEVNKANNPNNNSSYVVYKENIYVGYRYYETRYEDIILSQGNASGSAGIGSYSDASSWDYADEVCYPFGYGLSYSEFTQEFEDLSYDGESDTYTATVTVTNTSDIAGKEVIQIWGQSPYTDYDIENGIEKAAVQILGFEKVEVEANSSVTAEVTFDRYTLATYDYVVQEGYILEAGDYYFALGNGAHEALNNILAEKTGTVSGLTDHGGNAVEASSADTVRVVTQASADTESYACSRVDGETPVTNQFEDLDMNYWCDAADAVTYLTRNDWQGTFPTKSEDAHVNSAMEAGLKMDNYETTSETTPLSECTYDVDLDEKIEFADMQGVEFDDPLWDDFISQMNIEELSVSMAEARGLQKVSAISKPANSILEGPEGISDTFDYGDGRNATGFPTLPILAATWSHEMYREHGDRLGEEALYCGLPMINGPGANIHRTPYGGRASEYLSEDGLLTGYAVSDVMAAMKDKGLIGNLKHCFLNEQEEHRQGISTFTTEQAAREIYLKPFEKAISEKSTLGIMTSYNRLGLTYSAAYTPLLQNVMRGEWGYEGMVITDALTERDYAPTADVVMAGANMFCLDSARSTKIKNLITNNDDGDMLMMAQDSNHRILYALANSSMISSDYDSSSSMYWWQAAILGIEIGLGVVTAACLGMYVYTAYIAGLVRKKK